VPVHRPKAVGGTSVRTVAMGADSAFTNILKAAETFHTKLSGWKYQFLATVLVSASVGSCRSYLLPWAYSYRWLFQISRCRDPFKCPSVSKVPSLIFDSVCFWIIWARLTLWRFDRVFIRANYCMIAINIPISKNPWPRLLFPPTNAAPQAQCMASSPSSGGI
jgi:hypothetical protein